MEKCYEEERTVEAELNAKIDKLYKEKEEDRQRIHELIKKNTALEIEKTKLEAEMEIKRCDVRKCGGRKPPSDY